MWGELSKILTVFEMENGEIVANFEPQDPNDKIIEPYVIWWDPDHEVAREILRGKEIKLSHENPEHLQAILKNALEFIHYNSYDVWSFRQEWRNRIMLNNNAIYDHKYWDKVLWEFKNMVEMIQTVALEAP
jgi:hypothetical protein